MMNKPNSLTEDGENKTPDISQVIIENFTEVLKHIPMRRSDYIRIMRLLHLCIEKCGKVITADAIYPDEDSDPYEYDIYEDVDFDEVIDDKEAIEFLRREQ